jgi:hypothetical protein
MASDASARQFVEHRLDLALHALDQPPGAGKVLGLHKICKLAQAFLCKHSYKRLQLAQLLGQLGVFLT